MSAPAERVRHYLLALQDAICGALERADGGGRFREDRYEDAAAAWPVPGS